MFLSPAKKEPFDENGENDEFAVYPLKNKGFAPQTPENDENIGCHSAKAWFRKSQVRSSLTILLGPCAIFAVEIP